MRICQHSARCACRRAGLRAVARRPRRKDKPWHHGLINAKADAGIFMMVSTRDFAAKQGLKLEISQFKDDQIALKALIAGELDSFEGGPQGVFAADSKGADVKILGCHWVVVPHGIYAKRRHQQGRGPQGQVDRGVGAQFDARTCWRARRWRNTASPTRT